MTIAEGAGTTDDRDVGVDRIVAIGRVDAIGRVIAVGRVDAIGRIIANGRVDAIGRIIAIGRVDAIGRIIAIGRVDAIGRIIAIDGVTVRIDGVIVGCFAVADRRLGRLISVRARVEVERFLEGAVAVPTIGLERIARDLACITLIRTRAIEDFGSRRLGRELRLLQRGRDIPIVPFRRVEGQRTTGVTGREQSD